MKGTVKWNMVMEHIVNESILYWPVNKQVTLKPCTNLLQYISTKTRYKITNASLFILSIPTEGVFKSLIFLENKFFACGN